MIYFLTERVGGRNGGARAGVDILEACLLGTDLPVTVVGSEAGDVLGRLQRRAAAPPAWLEAPRFIRFPRFSDHRALKLLVKWLVFNAQDYGLRRRFERRWRRDRPALVVYNDFPHPHTDVFRRLKRSGKSVMVMHVSPKSLAFFAKTHDPAYAEGWAVDLLAQFDAFIFVSTHTRDAWLEYAPLQGKPAFVIPNCCREAEARALLGQDRGAVRAELGLEPGRFAVSCVATVQPGKGQDILVEALPEIAAQIPNVKLYFVGAEAEPEYTRTLRARLEELGLAAHAEFVGYREDGMSYTYASDLLVLPSRAESQPLVILEAMALGTPVVATNVDGIPDMIQGGAEGYLFDPAKPAELAARVVELYRDKALRDAFAERASQTYWRRFSKAQQVSRYGEVVISLLAS